jgi:hypothetical protein
VQVVDASVVMVVVDDDALLLVDGANCFRSAL